MRLCRVNNVCFRSLQCLKSCVIIFTEFANLSFEVSECHLEVKKNEGPEDQRGQAKCESTKQQT